MTRVKGLDYWKSAIATANSLDELTDILNEFDRVEEGCATLEDYGIDPASFPVFGCEQPDDLENVWSWDLTRILVKGNAVVMGKNVSWYTEPRVFNETGPESE